MGIEGAYFFIETRVGETRGVLRKIKETVREAESSMITGPYDVVTIVRCKELDKIGSTETFIKAVPGVIRVVACLIDTKTKK